jgi:LacI family transcriptional regulator
VFGGKDKCSAETRTAVLAAAKKLGYKPNLAARSLITHRSRLIGMILPSYVDTNTLSNSPFYNISIDSIYSVLRDEAYYDLIFFSLPHQEKLVQVSDWIDTRNVDGILAVGEYAPRFLKELDAKEIPVVLIDNYSRETYANFSFVNSDDETGGYLAARHLISKGYKKIALCGVAMYGPLMQRRYQGYERAMDEAGLEHWCFDAEGNPFEAGLGFAELLAARGFDAAFCTEDMAAVGVLHGMLSRGVRVGANFGLVGFDNINIGRQIFPELSTVDQNIYEKGVAAAQMLLQILDRKSERGMRLNLPVNLVARASA